MKKIVIIFPVLLIISLLIFTILQRDQIEQNTTDPAITITTSTSVSEQNEKKTEVSEKNSESEEYVEPCFAIPEMPKVNINRTRIYSEVGTRILLDSHNYFNIGKGNFNYRWQQVFGVQDTLEYVTNYQSNLLNITDATATFKPEVPGNYKFRLTTIDGSGVSSDYELDVWVNKAGRKLDVKGIIWGDVFGELGAPEFNISPEKAECLSKSLDHAINAPLRVGAEWIGIVPAAFYKQVTPSPIFADWGNTLSLTNETYYASIIDAAKNRGLKVMHTEQLALGLDLGQDQLDALENMKNDPQWWNEWYKQWKKWVVPRARLAEKYEVDMFVIYLFADDTFRPEVYPQYDERWCEIIAEVHKVYSGVLAINVINADERFTFVDAVDAVLVTIFPELYTSSGKILDNRNPTLNELEEQTNILFSYTEQLLAEKVPVYYVFSAMSSDGQEGGEPPPWGWGPPPASQVDFLEQVMYYEAFFNVLESKDWVSGVFTERWDWFDQFSRSGDSPEAYYYDVTLQGSPRSKPAEQVIKLWYGIYN